MLAASTADETEIAWLESRTAEAVTAKRRPGRPLRHRRSVSIRVREGRRPGGFETAAGEVPELEEAVRLAVAHSRAAGPPPEVPRKLPGPGAAVAAGEGLFDPDLADLTPAGARRLLESRAERRELARLAWSDALVVVANSRGLVQQARVSGVEVAARCGRGAGAGTAADAARSLAVLDLDGTFERARWRSAGAGETGDEAGVEENGAGPLVLAPEAVCDLVALLNHTALSARAFRSGGLLARGDRGRELFSPLLTLRDDGVGPRGLPLPFDLAGWPKRTVDLIARGVFVSPSLDPALARELGEIPTPHFVSADETRASHLFLLPGAATRDEIVAAGEGGLWIGRLDRLGPRLAGGDETRAVARGVRRVAAGALGPPLAPRIWEDRLTRIFREVLALGAEVATRPLGEEMLGGVTAPALVLAPGGTMRPAA